jgi:hypothetical protein
MGAHHTERGADMSFKTNTYQQLTLNDSYAFLSDRCKKIIDHSWAKSFADIVFPAIDENKFAVLYSDQKFSRPNTPVNVVIGALMLKEQMQLSDEELTESIWCDIRFQYALHTTGLKEQPVSDRTFSRFRERVLRYETETGNNLLDEEMSHLTDVYARYMNLNSNIRRMDSLMIASNCKRMSRLEIIYTTVSNAVRLFHSLGMDEQLPPELLHYLDDDDRNEVIYYCKGEDVTSRLDKVISDAVTMKNLMNGDEWLELSEYQLLIRVLKEQTDEDSDGKVTAKPKSEISPASLQNPSDPDATYRKKAGKDHKGYVGNIVETIGENGDSLITEASYEANSHSDSTFCKEHLSKRDDTSEHETIIADGAYGGVENQKLAESKNVTLVTTALTGKETDPIFAEFKLSEDGKKVVSCPCGHSPIKTTYYPKTGMCRALFPVDCCEHCPNRDRCKVKQQRKNYAVHVSSKMVSRAEYRKTLSSEEYKALTRMRNAIEGIPSVLRRRYHVDQIPVRGLQRSRFFFILKVAAYNFNKLNNHYKRQQVDSALAAANA